MKLNLFRKLTTGLEVASLVLAAVISAIFADSFTSLKGKENLHEAESIL